MSAARAMGVKAVSGETADIRTDLTQEQAYPHGLQSLSNKNKIAEVIQRLGKVTIEDAAPSKFVVPQSIYYELDGEKRRWDVIDSHDSVAVVLYHKDIKSFLLVRQFRPARYASEIRSAGQRGSGTEVPLSAGFTCELCAGIVDKPVPLEQIAKEEIHEECGFDVPLAAVKRITSFASSVGVQGSTQTLFFTTVDDSMRADETGGVSEDGERIELLALPWDSVEAFVLDDDVVKTSGAMFGLTWAKQHLAAEGFVA